MSGVFDWIDPESFQWVKIGDKPVYEKFPARNTDPSSSHEAARAIIATGDRAHQQHLAYAAVRAYPGRTSLELSHLTGLDRHMLGRRLGDVRDKGLITQGPKRRCTASARGLNAVTWEPVPVQLGLLS